MFWFRRKEARTALCAQLEETHAELQQAKQEVEKVLRERELDNEACRRAFTTHSSELTRAKADAEEQKLASQSLLADKAKLQAELIDHLKLLRLRDERLGILRRDLADSEFELDQLRVALRCTTEYSLHLEADKQAAEVVILQICEELDRLVAAAAAVISDTAANALGALSDGTTVISGSGSRSKDSEPARSPKYSGGVLEQPGGGRRSGPGAGVGAKGRDGRVAGSDGAGSWGVDLAGGGGGVRCTIGEPADGGCVFCGLVTSGGAGLEGPADGAAEGPRCRALRSGYAVDDNVDGAAAAATVQRAATAPAAAAVDGALKLYGGAAHLPERLSSVRQQLHALIVDPAAAAAAAAVAASAPKAAAAAPDLAAADAGAEAAAPLAIDNSEGSSVSTGGGDSGGGGRGGGSPPCPPATPQPAAAAAALLQLCAANPRRTGSEAPTECDAAVGGLRDRGHRRHAVAASAESAALAGLLLGSRGRCGGGGGSGGPQTAAAQAAGAGGGLSPWGSPPASVPLTPPALRPALAGLSEALQGWGAHGNGGGGVRGAVVVQGRSMGAASPPLAPSLLSSPTRCNGSYLPHPPAPSPVAAAAPPPPSPALIAVGQGSPHQRPPAPDQHQHHHHAAAAAAAPDPPRSRELDSELVSLRLTNEALQRQVAELQRQNDLLQLRQLGGGGGGHQQLFPEPPPHPSHLQHHHLYSHSGRVQLHSSPSGAASLGPWGPGARGANGPRQQQHDAVAAAAAAANPYSSPLAAPYYYGSLPPGRQPAFGVAAGGEPPLVHPVLGRTVVVSGGGGGGGGNGPTTHLAAEYGHPRGTQPAGPAAPGPGPGSRRDASPGASARAGATVAAPEDSAGTPTDREVAGGGQGRGCCQGAAATDGGTQLAPAVPPPPTATAIGPAAAAAVTAGPTHGLGVGPDVWDGKGSPPDLEALTPSPPAAAAAAAADAALAVAAPPGSLAAKVPPPLGVDPALWELDLLVACSKGAGL